MWQVYCTLSTVGQNIKIYLGEACLKYQARLSEPQRALIVLGNLQLHSTARASKDVTPDVLVIDLGCPSTESATEERMAEP